MTLWLYPDETPDTVADWLALRDKVETALRRPRIDIGRWTRPLWAFAGLAVISALLYLVTLAKRRPGDSIWRCWERDDKGYFHPHVQKLFPLGALLYAILACIATDFAQESLNDGYISGKAVVTEILALLVLFYFALTKAIAMFYTAPQPTPQASARNANMQVHGIRIPPRLFNLFIIFAYVSLGISMIVPFSVIGAYFDNSRRHHIAFVEIVDKLVETGLTGGEENQAAYDKLQFQGMFELGAALWSIYTAWTITKWILCLASGVFLSFALAYATTGYKILKAVRRHVLVYRRAAHSLGQLNYLQTAGPADIRSIQTRQTRCLDEVEKAGKGSWEGKLHETWFDKGAVQSMTRREEKRSTEGELRGQVSEVRRQYRFLLRYAIVMAAQIICTGMVTIAFIVMFIWASSNALPVPKAHPVWEVMLYLMVWSQAAWSATFAVPLGIAAVWVTYAPRPEFSTPAAGPATTTFGETTTRSVERPLPPVPHQAPPPPAHLRAATFGQRVHTIFHARHPPRSDFSGDTGRTLDGSRSGTGGGKTPQRHHRPSQSSSSQHLDFSKTDTTSRGGSSDSSQEPIVLSDLEAIKALRQKKRSVEL